VEDSFTSAPIAIPAEARGATFRRADIVIEGLEQAGPSFDGHVFLNNPSADAHTERVPATGYAGAVHVYGQGAPRRDAADASAGEVIAPITKHLIATDAVRQAVHAAGEVTVTVVPVARGAGELRRLRLGRVSIVFI
jgi:tyrosinase